MSKTDKEELVVSFIWVVALLFLVVLGITAFVLWHSKIALFVTIALLLMLVFWIYAFLWKVKVVRNKLKNQDKFKD